MKHYIMVKDGASGFDLEIKMPVVFSNGFVFFEDVDGQDWKVSINDVVEIGTFD